MPITRSIDVTPPEEEIPSQALIHISGDPIWLTGTPPNCRGTVTVQSHHKEPLRLKTIVIDAEAFPRVTESASATDNRRLVLTTSGKLQPGESKELPLNLEIAEGTPPGVYQASIARSGEAPTPVTIHVLEECDTRVQLGEFSSKIAPGESLNLQMLVKNIGNIDSVILPLIDVEIAAEDLDFVDYFNRAVRDKGEEGYGPVFDELVSKTRADLPTTEPAQVQVGAGPLAIQETRIVKMKITTPLTLALGRQFSANLRVGESQLEVTFFT